MSETSSSAGPVAPSSPGPAAPGVARAEFLKVYLPVAALVLAGFWIAWGFVEPPPPSTIRLAAGPAGGRYEELAQEYKRILMRSAVDLEVLETAGSLENLGLLEQREADIAFIQGGLKEEADGEELQALASLYFEPLWIFHREDLQIEYLADLAGMRIAIGPKGSGAQVLARRILEENGINAENTELLELQNDESRRSLIGGELDAAFYVVSAETGFIRELLLTGEAKVLGMRRHLAYQTRHRYLSTVVLGEGMLDLIENIPAETKTLVAPAAELAATDELHPALIPVLLATAMEIHGPGGLFEQPGQFPSEHFTEFRMDPQSRNYLQWGPSFLHRWLPFQWASLLDRLKILLLPLLTLLIPLIRMAPPVYQWRIRKKIYRWYGDLRRIDFAVESDRDADIRYQMVRLNSLESEFNGVEVPLSYMDEFYHLRLHIQLVREKLQRRIDSQGDKSDD